MSHRERVPTFYPMPVHMDSTSSSSCRGIPGGMTFLNQGGFGQVFISSNGMALYKLCCTYRNAFNDKATLREFHTLREVTLLAPQYVPSPVTLVRLQDLPHQPLAIQMMNAGESLASLNRLLEPLEIGLCMLQAIHFALLVGDAFVCVDASWKTMCVRLSGENIELRFIDAGLWYNPQRPGSFEKNVRSFLDDLNDCLVRLVAPDHLADALKRFYRDFHSAVVSYPARASVIDALRVLEAHLYLCLMPLDRVRALDSCIQPLLAGAAPG